MKGISALIMVALAFQPTVAAAAEAGDILRSAVVPGWGQYHNGRYARGTVMMGSALVTLTAIGGTTLQYNRHVDSYQDSYRRFQAATYVGDAIEFHRQAVENWNEADELYRYRSILIGVAAAVWAWSVLDMAFGPQVRPAPPVAIEPAPGGFKVSTAISF